MKLPIAAVHSYQGPAFDCQVYQASEGWQLDFTVKNSIINTRVLPHTHRILQEQLPGVLHTECFNYDGVPFASEVKRTEIAHLFEHILIYLLRETQLSAGRLDAIYEGVTSWNWVENPPGFFTITIHGPQVSAQLLETLIAKSARLTERVMNGVVN